MEKKYKEKGIFTFSYFNVKKCVEVVQEKNPDVTIRIKQSPKSRTIYLYFNIGDVRNSLRISDHDNKMTSLDPESRSNLIITEFTGISIVYQKIQARINALRVKCKAKNMKNLFDSISYKKEGTR